MGRTFDNNASNYMSRAACNLGLNGLTECSWAFWVKITNQSTTHNMRILCKEHAANWNCPITTVVVNTTKLYFGIESAALGQFPNWTLTTDIGTGAWKRVLFTWKRDAITSADGIVYVDGVAQSTTYAAGGYTAALTCEENSNELAYGVQANSHTAPLDGALGWVCVWNRKLTPHEAYQDFQHPLTVTSGLIHMVQLSPDTDGSGSGNNMTVTGTLAAIQGPREENVCWMRV